jgi:hypothetical protein
MLRKIDVPDAIKILSLDRSRLPPTDYRASAWSREQKARWIYEEKTIGGYVSVCRHSSMIVLRRVLAASESCLFINSILLIRSAYFFRTRPRRPGKGIHCRIDERRPAP